MPSNREPTDAAGTHLARLTDALARSGWPRCQPMGNWRGSG